MHKANTTTGTPDGSARPLPTISDLIDGSPTYPGGLYDHAVTLCHQLHFLMSDLEFAFDYERSRQLDDHSVQFMFQRKGIDATLWLVGQAWSRAEDLKDELEALQRQIDEEDSK